jgi:hypothetical protein
VTNFDRFLEKGSGPIAFRLSIAGFQYQPVTHRSMEKTELVQFANALPAAGSEGWTGTGSTPGTATSGIADPIGGTNAWTLTDDRVDATEAVRTSLNTYDGSPLDVEVTLKKDAAPTAFVGIRLTTNGTDDGSEMIIRLDTGAAEVASGTGDSISDIEVEETPTGWWRVRFRHAGTSDATTAALRIHPARGTTYPSRTAAATGSVTVYAPKLWQLHASRIRKAGLRMDGVKLSQKADLVMATVEATGATFRIADVGQTWTAAFNQDPSATTWLNEPTGSLSDTATTMTVMSTAAFPSMGYVHVNQETIKYTGKTATTFTGLSRGQWDTTGGSGGGYYHYTQTGASLRYPEVTDRTTILEGRRCILYFYAPGDDLQGDGTPFWRGIIKSEPRMRGPEWSIMADPLSSILDSELGADLEDPVFPRGIYFPDPGEFKLSVYYGSGVEIPTDGITTDESKTITVTFPTIFGTFFETQQEFIDAVNEQLALGMFTEGWTSQIVCVGSDDGTYHFEFTTDSASPIGVSVRAEHNGYVEPIEPAFHREDVYSTDSGPITQVTSVSASTTYYIWPRDTTNGRGTVPRGVYIETPSPDAYGTPPNRIYVDGSTALSSATTLASIDWPDDELKYNVGSIDAAARWISVSRIGPRGYREPGSAYSSFPFTSTSLPEIKLGRSYGIYGQGTYGLMSDLSSNTAQYVNTGAQPNITQADWDSSAAANWYKAYNDPGAPALARYRSYSSTEAVALKDILCPDLQLIGHFLCFSSDGKLTIAPLRLPSPTEVATYTIDRTNLLTDDGFPSYERGAAGIYNSLMIRDGYDAVEDKYTLAPIIVRDITSYGRQPVARTIPIELKSAAGVYAIDPDYAVELADRVIGIYGYPYAYVTCDVPLTALNSAILGSPVSITTAQLPGNAGTRGVTALVGLVTAREIDLYGARITLTILLTTRRVAGYAPGALVDSASNTSGNEWELELNASYFASGTEAQDFYQVDDDVMIYRFDSTTSGLATGTVTLVSGNTIRVLFSSAWTPGSDEWVLTLGYADSGAVTSNMKLYCYVADSSGVIGWDPGPHAPAFTFNPG